MSPIKSVAVIGAGPSGAIAIDALVQEKAFDKIRVFERQEKAGGCWFVKTVYCIVQGLSANIITSGFREMIRHQGLLTSKDWLRVQQMRR